MMNVVYVVEIILHVKIVQAYQTVMVLLMNVAYVMAMVNHVIFM